MVETRTRGATGTFRGMFVVLTSTAGMGFFAASASSSTKDLSVRHEPGHDGYRHSRQHDRQRLFAQRRRRHRRVAVRVDHRRHGAVPVGNGRAFELSGATSSTPYGRTGSSAGILRVVSSYITTALQPLRSSAICSMRRQPSCIAAHDAALSQQPWRDDPLPAIAHTALSATRPSAATTTPSSRPVAPSSTTFRPAPSRTSNKPGAISTTAYGVYGNKIAGGYGENAPGPVPRSRRSMVTSTISRPTVFTRYGAPDSVLTHFEGITSGGRAEHLQPRRRPPSAPTASRMPGPSRCRCVGRCDLDGARRVVRRRGVLGDLGEFDLWRLPSSACTSRTA